jgi:hypothetical protein
MLMGYNSLINHVLKSFWLHLLATYMCGLQYQNTRNLECKALLGHVTTSLERITQVKFPRLLIHLKRSFKQRNMSNPTYLIHPHTYYTHVLLHYIKTH